MKAKEVLINHDGQKTSIEKYVRLKTHAEKRSAFFAVKTDTTEKYPQSFTDSVMNGKSWTTGIFLPS